MTGARIFVAVVFVTMGVTFLASTGLLIYEFRELDWLTMVVVHSHLYLFYPVFGLLALVAFFQPSTILTHLYWNHIRYGRVRFIVGAVILAAAAYAIAWSLDRAPRAIFEVSPHALRADQGDAMRLPILKVLGKLRETAQHRFGLSSFGRTCVRDDLLELPEEMLKERYCFPAGKMLDGVSCCRVQKAFGDAVASLEADWHTRSKSAMYDEMVFLPVKTFFILVVVAIAVLLAIWRNHIDQYYSDLVPTMERGVIIGGFAMLFWLAMDYGYQQTVNVLFGRQVAGPQLRLSLVLVPWALLLLFYFLRRLGKEGELVGQISGVVFAGVAVLRYEQLNDWVVRLFGIGADQWVLSGLLVVVLVGLFGLFGLRQVSIYPSKSPASG